MADRSLDTGEFNQYGEWQSFRGPQQVKSGPSPFPLLALTLLIALIMLLRPQSEAEPRPPGANNSSAVSKDSR